MEAGYQRVCDTSEVLEWRPKRATLDGIEIVVFRTEGALFAVENLCPHQRFSRFHDAVCDGHVVTCPMHGWSFDVRTGNAVAGSGRLRVFDLKVEGSSVHVRVPGSSALDSLRW